MLNKILFAVYAGLIPLVPLLGADLYKRNGDRRKRNVCIILFTVQTIISAGSIISYI